MFDDVGEVQETAIDFEWKIDSFFSLSKKDSWYTSPCFSYCGESWYLAIYPNGDADNVSVGCVDLCVVKESDDYPIKLEFSLALKTVNGDKDLERHSVVEKRHYELRFISRSELWRRKAELVPSGVLTVVCTFRTPKSSGIASKNNISLPSVVPPKSKILDDFKQLFLNQENSDVVLRVKGREFSAHKAILTARCPVFASMFRNDMKEKGTGIVDVEDCDPSSFSDFLCFLYCEELKGLSEENVFSLFIAADKYDVTDLRTKCLEFMKENVSIDTFCETITMALQHCETELLHFSTDFFIENAEEILETVKWQTFAAENPTQSNELFIKYVKSIKHSNK